MPSDSKNMISLQGVTRTLLSAYSSIVRALVYALAVVSGLGIVVMMTVTCADVLLRESPWPLVGAVDLVKLTGAITIACALPYTTAVKGHVAIEYFFQKLSHMGRVVVDSLVRVLGIMLFGALAWQGVGKALQLQATGEVTMTLQIPVFWVMYVVAFSCATVALVIFDNMLHPGREMIKP